MFFVDKLSFYQLVGSWQSGRILERSLAVRMILFVSASSPRTGTVAAGSNQKKRWAHSVARQRCVFICERLAAWRPRMSGGGVFVEGSSQASLERESGRERADGAGSRHSECRRTPPPPRTRVSVCWVLFVCYPPTCFFFLCCLFPAVFDWILYLLLLR